MSRKSNTSWWSLRRRSKPSADGAHGSRRPRGRASRTVRLLAFEGLESRTLLSITASVSGTTASFVSNSNSDALYLETTSSGLLAYHDQNTSTFSTNLGGATLDVRTQAVTSDTQVATSSTTSGSVGVYLEGIFTGGQSLTIQAQSQSVGVFNQFLTIQSTVDTQGGNFTVGGFTNVTFGTALGGGVMVSTRNLGGGINYLTGASQGDSGTLTVTVANPEPYNPLPNNGLNIPTITVDAGSDLLAQATGSSQPGAITLTATNTNYVLDGLSFPTLNGAVRSSTVDFLDGTASSDSMVEGGRSTSRRPRATSRWCRRSRARGRRAPTAPTATTRPRPGGPGSGGSSTPRCKRRATCRG